MVIPMRMPLSYEYISEFANVMLVTIIDREIRFAPNTLVHISICMHNVEHDFAQDSPPTVAFILCSDSNNICDVCTTNIGS